MAASSLSRRRRGSCLLVGALVVATLLAAAMLLPCSFSWVLTTGDRHLSAAGCQPCQRVSITAATSEGARRSARTLTAAAAAEGVTVEAGAARERFLQVLKDKHGNTKDAAVVEELERLMEANPNPEAALSGEFLDATWLQVSAAEYAIGSEDGNETYTLGKLSFGMYEPVDMKFHVDQTTQLVAPGPDGTRRWDIQMDLTCVDERFPPFKAKMVTVGQIKPAKDKQGRDARLDVCFTGGTLSPAEPTDEKMKVKWLDVFGAAQTGRKRTIGSMLKNGLLRLMMGLRLPDSVATDGSVTFEMRKPPKGYTDILYMDDKLRVTRGNRGSVVVVTREGPIPMPAGTM